MNNPKKNPILLERISDGEILIQDSSGLYGLARNSKDKEHIYPKWSYETLFEDEKNKRQFKKFKTLNFENMITRCEKELCRGNKNYNLFAIERNIFFQGQSDFSNYLYQRNIHLKEKFNKRMSDEDFSTSKYIIAKRGVLDKENNSNSWTNEIKSIVKIKSPENLIFYLKKDLGITSTRILIPKADFYGGLTNEEARKKYGKDLWKKMTPHLRGITVSRDSDGEVRLPYNDLGYAHNKALGIKTSWLDWD